jgi:predicted enzyme involved in methoxymalonyl-ACP biosynthesis
VGAVFTRREADTLVIDEIAISCRALGRQVEGMMIAEAIRGVVRELPVSRVACRFTPGPRNEPARKWFVDMFDSVPTGHQPGVRDLGGDWLSRVVDAAPVAIRWVSDD